MLGKIIKLLDSVGCLNYRIIFLIDLSMSFIGTCLSCLLTRYLVVPALQWNEILYICTLSLLINIALLSIFNTHRNIIRYSYLKDLWALLVLPIIKVFLLVGTIDLFFQSQLEIKQLYCYLLFDIILSSILLITIRLIMVLAFDAVMSLQSYNNINAVIYGIDNESFSLMSKIKYKSDYRIRGFFVFGNQYRKYKIAGNKVFHFNTEHDFNVFTERYKIKAVIFPNYATANTEKNRLVSYCLDNQIRVLISPQVDEIKDNNLGKEKRLIRNIKIEDLLMRDEIQIDMNLITEKLCGKTVLVTGAAGSIGSELCHQLARIGIKKLILLDFAETPIHNLRLNLVNKHPDLDFITVLGDVRIKKRVENVISTFRPNIIFHAAAYKHVPLMEENPCEAVMVNIHGTRLVADMAVKYGVEKMILVSTDKAVNPTNVMGASKRMAEIYVQSLGLAIEKGEIKGITKFITTRFGNVLGSQGSVIPLFKMQIEAGGPVTVTHPDITRYFMTIPEACKLVVEAATIGHNNEIVVFDMGESVRIADLAYRMIKLAGYVPNQDIHIEYTGLRLGEKLYEEVLSSQENTIPTSYEKIRIAKVRKYSYSEVSPVIHSLSKLALTGDEMATVMMIKEMIPEYHSENSKFKELDLIHS